MVRADKKAKFAISDADDDDDDSAHDQNRRPFWARG
jgi:hypothetical protein